MHLIFRRPAKRDIVVGIRPGVLVWVVEMLRMWFELPDPCDYMGDLDGRFDLVLDMPGGFVDKGGSDRRALRESECAATHLDVKVVGDHQR